MQNQFFYLVQIVLGVILTGLIILQSKGTGLGSTFGGDMGFYGTKRGAEKLLFILTIAVASIFLLSLVLAIIL